MKKYFCSINEKFIWFPVPKVATQSFEKTLNQSGGELTGATRQKLPNNYDDLFSFIIVRNPWDRLVSAWKDKVKKQWTDRLDPFRIRFYKKYKDMEFKDFVMSLDVDTIRLENHIKPVVHLSPLANIKYIGRLETVWQDCSYIFSTLGLEFKQLQFTNSTTPWSPGSPFCKYNEYYDNETRDKVAHLYREDIDILKYTFD